MSEAIAESGEEPESDNMDTGFVEEVELAGHIIDSLILPKVLDEISALGGRFEILDISIGHLRHDPSSVSYTHLTLPTKRIV